MSKEIWAALAAPFPFEDIKVMPQTMKGDGTKALAVAYFDARAVMNRLDDVLTPAGWRAEYRAVEISEKAKGVICRLTVFVDGGEVVREDGSDPSDIEGFKGCISGALKRAFAALGNRTLYDTELGWQPCDTYERGGKKVFSEWTDAAMKAMEQRYNKQTRQGQPAARPAPPAAQPATTSGAPTATPNDDPDRHRRAVFATLAERGIEYVGDGKRAVLSFLSKTPGAPPDGFASSTLLTPAQWQERRAKLDLWAAGSIKISVLDTYRDQQGALPV